MFDSGNHPSGPTPDTSGRESGAGDGTNTGDAHEPDDQAQDGQRLTATDGGDLGHVRLLLDQMIESDPAGLPDEALYSMVLDLEAVRRRVDVATAALVTELGTRRCCDLDHGLSTEGWLAHNARLPLGATRSRVRTAKKLHKHFGPVLDALNDDRITWDHGKVLANVANPRIIGQLVEMTEELLVLADHMSFETWSREIHNIAENLDTEGGHRPGDDISDNHLNVSNFVDNTVVINGQLCGELGLIVRDSINEEANRIFHRMTRDNTTTDGELTVPNRATLRALALAELITRANASTTGGDKGPRADLSLIVNASDPGTITDRHGVIIGDTDRFTSLCDPIFQTVVMNTQGIVTDLGRRQRLASAAQRRAMAHRDGGCVFPGCDAPPEWTDAHHVHPWLKGGRTDLADLASLCRSHHGVTHRKGWTMATTPDGWFTWTTPRGGTIHSQRHGRQHPDPARRNDLGCEENNNHGDDDTDRGHPNHRDSSRGGPDHPRAPASEGRTDRRDEHGIDRPDPPSG